MVFDYSKLKGRIVEKYGSQTAFASAFGITKVNMSKKLRNETSFSQADIIKSTELLGIDREQINEYFFTEKV